MADEKEGKPSGQPPPTSKIQPQPENLDIAVGFLATHERWKTVRTLVVCTLIGFCVWKVVDLIQKVLDQPWWVALLVGGAAPSSVAVLTLKMFKRYVNRNNQRVKDLEQKVHPDRTSSGLERDGGSKYDL